MNHKKVLFLTQGAVIAALYVVLTFLANVLGLASSLIQVRFSEMLTILPFFTPAAIPGLFIGCLSANLLTGAHMIDVVFGSLATLLAAWLSYIAGNFIKKSNKSVRKLCVCLPPILCNGLIVPFILKYAYGVVPIWLSMLTVTAGEIISAGILGMLFFAAVEHSGLHKLIDVHPPN